MNYSYLWIVLFIIIILELYWRNKKARRIPIQEMTVEDSKQAKEVTHNEINIDDQPDLPVPFGYKCQWMAVKSTDTEGIADILKLMDTRRANWKTGIEAAYHGLIFVSPPIKGWTFIVGSLLPDFSEDQQDPSSITSKVINLSSAYGEAQYFGNQRIVGYHAWMKAIEGKVIRAFAYLGERGEIISNDGAATEEEQKLQIVYTEEDIEANEDDARFPNEEDVLFIAKSWSVDPMMKDEGFSPGTGYVGRLTN